MSFPNKYINSLDSLNYYSATKKYDLRYPALKQDLEADVVIIGGGFSGINTALELAEQGVKNIVVLEARHLGYGGTGRNGGQIMAGIGHDMDAIKKDVGEEGLQAIFEISNQGQQIIKERVKRYNIDADFRNGYGYTAFNKRQQKVLQEWQKEFQTLEPDTEIELVTGSAIQDVVGTDAYCAVLKHMGGGHVHSLNLLLGEANALTSEYGVQIFENTEVLEVEYGPRVTVRTAMGSVKAEKMLWACNAFLKGLEPRLHKKTINTLAFQIATEPLSDELIHRISPIRGAYSDIRPVIDYYRVTNENRLLFGGATHLVEYLPKDLFAWNRNLMLRIFPYLANVKIDMAWGGPMACGVNLFPQIGSLDNHNNVFYVQGYAGFGVTPSQIICKVLAEGILGGSDRYQLISSISHADIVAKDQLRALLLTGGKCWHQLNGYLSGRR
ncbi:NAD(P)/FAD-dependent oxidoreductase [Gynuella sunshinyii]|uniref:Glycine/D-amino acid oxidase (Deaminating) n=1 Tax=Gynuella sunshinyii YC6258 TaxID=1445510 RepID=A0A0C5VSK1_9GAMM|nr:FAD-binding oxidoreductase [Gynuella sunshinyii]AJQ97667.1 glycine/D-amino acid oxidase (deaminating) [Gynuella sunshinyii YC6258]